MSLHTAQHTSSETLTDATNLTRDWLIAGAAVIVALLALYAVFIDDGSLVSATGNYLHEFTHDGRHLLGAPCH
jgi:hypothetical protein